MRLFTFFVLSLCLVLAAGCGYTTTSLLPPDVKSIHVANFINKINPAREVSDKRAAFFYRPGLETDITRNVIDGFIFDRHLDVKNVREADILLKGQLKDLQQYPLSYSAGGGDITEFRVEVIVDIELYNNRSGELMWKEKGFMGQSDYDVTGPNRKTEAEGVKAAVKDLAQRIVERTVEAW